MITLTIDNKKVKARKNETVLEVAQREGIYIPTLCYHADLSAYGGCRLCVVDVKGIKRPVTSCTLPVEDGMVVRTNTSRLKKLRRFSLQLILSEHPHACLVCEKQDDCSEYQECIQKSAITFGCKFCSKNENCELQELMENLNVKEIPFEFNYRNLEIERCDPFFDRDYNICILCGRCVRVCQEVRHAYVLDFHHRGPETLVGSAFGLPHLETGCQFCGACIDVCPTGALRDRYGKWLGVPERSVKTSCTLCNLGCSIKVHVKGTAVVNSTSDKNQVCVRGRFGLAPLVHHPKRVTVPMVKRGDRLVQVEWDEALGIVNSSFVKYRGRTGILYSPQLTEQAIDGIYDLADHLKCSNVVTTITLNHIPKSLDVKKIERTTVLVVVNTDLVSDFAPLFVKLMSSSGQKPSIIVIDAIPNKTTEIADLWLKPVSGKEIDVVQHIFSSKNKKTAAGVSIDDIKRAKAMLADKNACIIHDSQYVIDKIIPKNIPVVTLTNDINTSKIYKMGVDRSIHDLVQDKKIDCMYLVGTAPQLTRKYKHVVVQDCFLPSFDFDVFLPAATPVEISGSIIDIEGKRKRLRKVIEPQGRSRSDEWIITQVNKQLKSKKRKRRSPRRKKIAIRATTKSRVSNEYPYSLIVRQNSYCFRGNTLSDLMKGFHLIRNDSYVWINKSMARKLKLNEGTRVRVIGKRLNLTLPARVTQDIPEDHIFLYCHSGMGIISNQPVRLECIKL